MSNNTEQVKDLQYFKDQVAEAYGTQDYRHCFDIGSKIAKILSEEEFFDKAAERYAKHREQVAKEQHALEMTNAQERISERISIAVAEAEGEWRAQIRQAKDAAFNRTDIERAIQLAREYTHDGAHGDSFHYTEEDIIQKLSSPYGEKEVSNG